MRKRESWEIHLKPKEGDHTYVYKRQNSKQVYRPAPNEKEMFKSLSLPLGNTAHGQYDFL